MNKKFKIIIIFLLFFIISVSYYFFSEKHICKTYSLDSQKKSKNKDINTKQNKTDQKEDENHIVIEDNYEEQYNIIKVYITGEINKPGVYSAKEGSRIEDIIKMAEGPTKDADLENINLALLISDEEHIIVPKKMQDINKNTTLTIKENNKNNENNVTNNKNTKNNNIININTATLKEIETLKGIGPVIGKNIIEHREKNGKFQKIEDIKNVKRIGEATFQKIKDNICVK